jgi:serine/threonine protein kinase
VLLESIGLYAAMAEAPAYTGLREGYILLPFPEEKQLNPRDIDWRIEALLGRGNFGQVVRGTWRGKPSALKIANPNNGQEAIDLLMEEATMMAYVTRRGRFNNYIEKLAAK